jgi:hypothetical protein
MQYSDLFEKNTGILLLALACLAMFAPLAHAYQIKPYKDRIFKYRTPIAKEDNGDFQILPYDPKLDINKRDEMPVRKVKGYYVSSRPKRHERDLSVSGNGKQLTHFAVGKISGGSKMTVIFLHGRDGSRHLGFNDDKFGGNFNRVKNLMYRNSGLYISADFSDFEEEGRKDIEALVSHYRPKTTGKLVVACGSMGSFLCWRLMKTPASNQMIDGYVIMGGFPDPAFVKTGQVTVPAGQKPIYMAHGGIDYVYSWKDAKRFYDGLRSKAPGYPVRLVVFDGGKHGTPVRMIDWRVALNWIAAQP